MAYQILEPISYRKEWRLPKNFLSNCALKEGHSVMSEIRNSITIQA